MAEVKEPLNFLLDALHKRFQMATLYAIEKGKAKRLHVHLLFLFYGTSPFKCKDWLAKFRPQVFNAWNKLNGGELSREANDATIPDKLDPTYFIKYVQTLPRGKKKCRELANWWGCRNKKLLIQHRVPVDQDRLKAIMKVHKALPIQKRNSDPMNHRKWKPPVLLEDDPAYFDQFEASESDGNSRAFSELMLLAMTG